MKTILTFLIFAIFSNFLLSQEGRIFYSVYSDVYYLDPATNSEVLFYKKRDWDGQQFKIMEDDGLIYWTNTNMILSAKLDGSEIDTIHQNLVSAFALDVGIDFMVWTDSDEDIIYKSNLDGSNKEELVNTGISTALNIKIDTVSEKIIWSDRSAGEINRVNYDGSGFETILNVFTPTAIRLDYINYKMYWVQNQTGEIHRANLDGTNTELVTTINGTNSISDISLDIDNNTIYYSYRTDFSSGDIRSINLNNDQVTIHYGNLVVPSSIYFNSNSEDIFWMDSNSRLDIQSFNITSQNRKVIISSDGYIKQSFIYRDSILFFAEHGGVSYFDFKTNNKYNILTEGGVNSITIDSNLNVYWIGSYPDTLFKYDFAEKKIESLYEVDVFGGGRYQKIQWLKDNRIIYAESNIGFYILDLNTGQLSEVFNPQTNIYTFGIDDSENRIYFIDSGPDDEIFSIDILGNFNNPNIGETYQLIRDMSVYNNTLYISSVSGIVFGEFYVGGLEKINLINNSSEILLDSIDIHGIYIFTAEFPDLSEEVDIPNLAFPINNATNVLTNIGLMWDPISNVDSFIVQLDTEIDFSSPIFYSVTTSDNSISLPQLENNKTYFWRVKAKSLAGESEWSEVWSFTTEIMTNIEEVQSEYQLKAYPNPTKSFVFIELNSPKNNKAKLYIFNLTGSLINSKEITIIKEKNLIEVDLQDFLTGTYKFRILGEEFDLFGGFTLIK